VLFEGIVQIVDRHLVGLMRIVDAAARVNQLAVKCSPKTGPSFVRVSADDNVGKEAFK
jgi:hypothetical protein